jgi:hypothetical protein
MEGSSLCGLVDEDAFYGELGKTYPRGQSKLSSGLTSGTSDLEMKLPSTYTLAFPARKVYSEAFLIFAC